MIVRIFLLVLVMSSTVQGEARAQNARPDVSTDSRGETFITAESESIPLYETQTTDWICVDPVSVAITKTVREGEGLEIARVSIRIANVGVWGAVHEELSQLAENPFFSISPSCIGDVPIARVIYAESVDYQRGFATARLVERKVRLRAPAVVVQPPPSE